MNKTKKPTATILLCILLGGFVLLCGYATRLPPEIADSETFFAKITSDIKLVDIELTKLASETTLTPFPTPSINSQNWPDHFLYDPTCQIPCWENITPNITEIHTAQKIVAGISGVQVIYLEPKEITWYFDDDSSKSAQIIANQNGIVLQIDLKLGYDQTLLLSDVINSFGNPDAILEGLDCNVILSYRYQGMLLSAYTSCSRNPVVDIKPTTEIDRIILFSPDNQEHTLSVFRFNMDEIMWDGYKTYDFTNK